MRRASASHHFPAATSVTTQIRTVAAKLQHCHPAEASSTAGTAMGDRPMSPSESASREALIRQQRNMAPTEPIARLSRDRRVIFQDAPALAERLDVRYLALSAIDFVMERSTIEAGASPDDIVEHVAGEAVRMKPTLTEKQGRKAGQVVLDHLSNAREGHKTFRVEYYDADRGGFSFQCRLLALSAADDESPQYKLARGAQTLTLAMLDIAPEFVQEAETIMIRKAVERGRFEDALTLARRSRMRSIHYRQFIEDRLFQVRRAADRVRWSEEVLPEPDDARTLGRAAQARGCDRGFDPRAHCARGGRHARSPCGAQDRDRRLPSRDTRRCSSV